MQKFIFLFSAAVILGLTACEKCSTCITPCSTCSIFGIESAQYCGEEYDEWVSACNAAGGTVNQKPSLESAEFCGKGDEYEDWELACAELGGTLNEK